MAVRFTRGSICAAVVLGCALAAGGCRDGAGAAPKVDAVAELQALHVPSLPKEFTPAQRAQIEGAWNGPGAWFVKTGCFACHAVSIYDITPLSPVGPDLALAVEDVKSRFGRPLDEFLAEPTGTMQMVFSQLLVLTPEQKKEALKQLETAFAEYQKKAAH